MDKKKISISESPAILIIDEKFKWVSKVGQKKCECQLRIYKISIDRAVVIVSELQDNPGRSITDEAIILLNLVCYKFGFSTQKIMWIEHYPEGYLKEEDTYDEVRLVAFGIESKRIKKERLEALLKVEI